MTSPRSRRSGRPLTPIPCCQTLEPRTLLCADAVDAAPDTFALTATTSPPGPEANATPAPEPAVAVAAVGDPQLPDLLPIADASRNFVYGWTIDTTLPPHTRLLMNTAVINRGAAPMEVRSTLNPDRSQDTFQRIYSEGGGYTDRPAGTYTLGFGRFGIAGFLAYRIRAVAADGSAGDVLASTERDMHCLRDSVHYESLPNPPGTSPSGSCNVLHAGWAGAYGGNDVNQPIDVTALHDGHYWLEIEVDPYNRLVESDETNNVLRLPIDLDLPSSDPKVVSSTPAGQQPYPVGQIDLKFDQPMDAASFSVADDVLSFTGPGGADLRPTITGSQWLSPTTVRVLVEPQSTEGDYALTIGPNVLAADNGQPMDQDRDETPGETPDDVYTATFHFDPSLGPDSFGYEAFATPPETIHLAPGEPGVFTLFDNVTGGNVPIDLGTNTFSFYGHTYSGTDLRVTTSGLITPDLAHLERATNLARGLRYPTIAPLWGPWRTDMTPNDAVYGRIDDTTGDGVPDRLVVEWQDGGAIFQAVLQLNTGDVAGDIRFQYPFVIVPFSGPPTATGIRDGSTTPRHMLVVQENNLASPFVQMGRAILIRRTSVPAEVVDHHLFYNNSVLDGRRPAADAGDDAAIVPDVFAAQATTYVGRTQLSGYSRGIDGLMVDIQGLPPGDVGADDFLFRAGTTLDVASWAPAPGAPTVSVRRGAGTDGSDRVTLTWPDGTIRNTWLQVTVLPTAHTGLSAAHVFYFGSLVGDVDTHVAPPTASSSVGAADLVRVRAARGAAPGAPRASDVWSDVNVDGVINVLDEAIVRSNFGRTLRSMAVPDSAVMAVLSKPAPLRRTKYKVIE